VLSSEFEVGETSKTGKILGSGNSELKTQNSEQLLGHILDYYSYRATPIAPDRRKDHVRYCRPAYTGADHA